MDLANHVKYVCDVSSTRNLIEIILEREDCPLELFCLYVIPGFGAQPEKHQQFVSSSGWASAPRKGGILLLEQGFYPK